MLEVEIIKDEIKVKTTSAFGFNLMINRITLRFYRASFAKNSLMPEINLSTSSLVE